MTLEVVFLGTGSPLPSADRCGAGAVLVAGDTHILVDCGWGSARKLIPSGIQPSRIDTAILTHMHSDHITDIPDFLFLRWVTGSTIIRRSFRAASSSGWRSPARWGRAPPSSSPMSRRAIWMQRPACR